MGQNYPRRIGKFVRIFGESIMNQNFPPLFYLIYDEWTNCLNFVVHSGSE